MWEVLCKNDIVKILLCEGGDVELGDRTRNISLYLRLVHSLSLSLLYLALIHIAHIIYMLGIDCVCAHTCVQSRELQIAPQLLFRGI